MIMKSITRKAFLILSIALGACGSAESSSSQVATEQNEIISLMKQYHTALVNGDSVSAVSFTTGTARATLEYRFFRLPKGNALLFQYGSPNVIRDTCYVPFSVKNTKTNDPATSNKAVLVKVDGEWKIERLASGK
jgi:hypothetical protein